MVLCFFLLRKRVEGAKPFEELPGSAECMTWIMKLALIDWIGTFLFVIGGILILLALNWGPNDDWKSVRVIACLVVGVIVFVTCILWEVVLERKHQASTVTISALYHAQPMLPLKLFRSYDICVLYYGCSASGVVIFVMFYFVAIFMTVVSGLPPDQASIQLLYFAPGLVCFRTTSNHRCLTVIIGRRFICFHLVGQALQAGRQLQSLLVNTHI